MTVVEDSLKEIAVQVDSRLPELVCGLSEPGTLQDAMLYSLTAGGKRLRPWLCIKTATMFGDAQQVLDFACAIEMIHTYSLIHDDLPAMDDDVLRRGRPTNHMVFGEAVAILAGDALLNGACEVMTRFAIDHPSLSGLAAMELVMHAAGASGMVAGQVGDIEFECKDKDEKTLYYIHERKTGALIHAAILSGAALMGASGADIDALSAYGKGVGLVFQIADDILDVTSSADALGKTPGKDAAEGKQTFVSVYGLQKAREIASEQTQTAVDMLARFGSRAEELNAMAQFLLNRDR